MAYASESLTQTMGQQTPQTWPAILAGSTGALGERGKGPEASTHLTHIHPVILLPTNRSAAAVQADKMRYNDRPLIFLGKPARL